MSTNTALAVEFLKFRQSRVGRIGSAMYLVGTVCLLGVVTFGLRTGNEQLIAKAGPGVTQDWAGLMVIAQQLVTAGGLLTAGVVLTWLFAREFSDRTLPILLVATVTRFQVAAAKLAVFVGWAASISAAVTVVVYVFGLVLGYVPDWRLAAVWAHGMAAMLCAAPVAWVATHFRSLLAGVGATVVLLVALQVLALAGVPVTLAWCLPTLAAPGGMLTLWAWARLTA